MSLEILLSSGRTILPSTLTPLGMLLIMRVCLVINKMFMINYSVTAFIAVCNPCPLDRCSGPLVASVIRVGNLKKPLVASVIRLESLKKPWRAS